MPNILLTFTKDSDRPDYSSPIKPGVYNVIVDTSRTELKKTKTDKPFINIAFRITDDGDFKDRLVFANYFLNAEATWKLKKMLKALGQEVPDEGSQAFDTNSIHGVVCRIIVKNGTYNGEITNDVQDVLPPAEVSTGFNF